MYFSDEQERRLRAKVHKKFIRRREVNGRTLSYIEGWHVVAEANRIFGFDGWDRETVDTKCVWTKQIGARYAAAYVTRVRIAVLAGERRIIRDGTGVGEAVANSPGQAHEIASKIAETDATKRAFITFGNSFGLSLYAEAGRGHSAIAQGDASDIAPPVAPSAAFLATETAVSTAPLDLTPEGLAVASSPSQSAGDKDLGPGAISHADAGVANSNGHAWCGSDRIDAPEVGTS